MNNEELPESPIDRASRIAYYTQMEQDALNMLNHARKQLGLLAVDVMYSLPEGQND